MEPPIQLKLTQREIYERHRLKKGDFEFGRADLLRRCKKNKHFPTKASIEKYKISQDELLEIFNCVLQDIYQVKC